MELKDKKMNKSKVLLTIAKLLGTALVLSFLLIMTSTIEAIQAIYSAIKSMQEKPIAAPMLMLAAVKEESPQPTPPVPILLIPTLPDITFFLPKHRAIANQLPRDYLTVKMLKQWAKEIGVKGYSKMLTSQLVQVHSIKQLRGNYVIKALGIA